VGAKARACKLLSLAELETYFGGKSTGVKGLDSKDSSVCAYRFIDTRHQVTLEVHGRNDLEDVLTPEQRIQLQLSAAPKGTKAPETKVYGDVACYKSNMKTEGKPLPSTVCFQTKGGFLGLTFSSDDPQQITYERTKSMFDKVAPRRK
jgi:hypothetical protein